MPIGTSSGRRIDQNKNCDKVSHRFTHQDSRAAFCLSDRNVFRFSSRKESAKGLTNDVASARSLLTHEKTARLRVTATRLPGALQQYSTDEARKKIVPVL